MAELHRPWAARVRLLRAAGHPRLRVREAIDDEPMQLFAREARLLAMVGHPNVGVQPIPPRSSRARQPPCVAARLLPRGTLDAAFAADRIATVELGPGQALFVPVAWFHEVTALDPSMTLSFVGFRWPNHFHWLGPASDV